MVQRKRIVDYLKTSEHYPCIEEREKDDEINFRKYVFMTTVSMPAFEQRDIQVSLKISFKIILRNFCVKYIFIF